jgi:hypothetical protein
VRREGDDEDVVLAIDSAGVYLGGSYPQTVPWSDVHGLCRIERRTVDDEGEESWHPRLIVLKHPDSALPRLSKNWGPSCDWPGGLLTKPLAVEDLAAAVRQHAPHLQVTDRGRIPD